LLISSFVSTKLIAMCPKSGRKIQRKSQIEPKCKIELKRPLEYLLKIRPSECEFRVVPDENDRFRAYGFILLLTRFEGAARPVYNIASRIDDSRFLYALSPREKRRLVEIYNDMYGQYMNYEKLQRDVEDFIMTCLRKYVWLRYFACLPYTTAKQLLCLVFYPPTMLYTTEHIDLNFTNWRNLLIPLRKVQDGEVVSEQKARVAKTFYTEAVKSYFYDPRFISLKRLVDRAAAFNNSKLMKTLLNTLVNREIQSVMKRQMNYDDLPREKKRQVVLRAFRDLMRIYLTNTYLVAWWYLCEKGIDKDKCVRNPEKVKVPYEAIKNPLALLDYVDPFHIVSKRAKDYVKLYVPDIENIMWKRVLAKIVLGEAK